MDIRVLKFLRCPVSGTALRLTGLETVEHDGRTLVRTGILHSETAKIWYPIINHVPLMLVFDTGLRRRFAADHAAALAKLGDYAAPDLAPMPGEVSVQRTFTEEWGGLQDDARTFMYSDEELLRLHRDIWLRMSAAEIERVGVAADIGCGFGKEAMILAEIFPRAEVFAVDLNLALLQAGERLDKLGRLHPVVASLFRLPLAAGVMDHVHCQGVIHHTYSSKAAFDAIAPLVQPRGSLFVWVYAKEDSLVVPGLRGAVIRAYWLISHHIGRPILSRLPGFLRNSLMFLLTCILHPILKSRDRRGQAWFFRNSLHGLRDAFTPRYAHQHGFNEVLEWFEGAGFEPQVQSPHRYRQLMGKRLLGIGALGRRLPADGGARPAAG